MPKCPNCDDCFWVCESHEDLPWEGERSCDCGSAGMPCPKCNPPVEGKMPKGLPGSTEIWNIHKGWIN